MNYYTVFTWCIQVDSVAHPALCRRDTRFLSGRIKRPGRGVVHPTSSSAGVKGGTDVYV